jgi:hypothetical protein
MEYLYERITVKAQAGTGTLPARIKILVFFIGLKSG